MINSLMSVGTFDSLQKIREHLEGAFDNIGPVFVPWVGTGLGSGSGGIYYIGQATDGEFGKRPNDDFQSCYERTRELCVEKHERSHTPFWRFLERLTQCLLGGSYSETHERWGWSNLLKIGQTKGTPRNWEAKVIQQQRSTCIGALQEEMAGLRDSLIFVASGTDFMIVDAILDKHQWDTRCEEHGVWWQHVENGNLVVNGYHPAYAQRCQFFDTMAETTIDLARKNLSWCAASGKSGAD